MRACIVVVAVLSFAACGGPTPQPAAEAAVAATPSDVDFLAARAAAAARILALFDANDMVIAPHPESVGPLVELDPAEFSAAGNVALPMPTSRLTRCHVATVAALAAFAAVEGPALGEGKMGPPMTAGARRSEIRRQLDVVAAAYCLWRDAARTCHAEVAAIPLFEPEHLACDDSYRPASASGYR